MKRLVYIATAAVALSIASCTDGSSTNDNNGCDSDSVTIAEGDTGAIEVTGVVIDGARRNIDLQVDNDTLNFELTSSEDVSWEIGDTLTIRYYKTAENGDSVVEVLDHE